MIQPRIITIIGAGIAGLSAALHLLEKGYNVIIYEASHQAGGRCRSFFDNELQSEIDNGSHILLGANKEALDFIRKTGSSDRFNIYTKGFPFIDFNTNEQWVLKSLFDIKIPESKILIKDVYRLLFASSKYTVSDCLNSNENMFKFLWKPMTESILNTPPDTASAIILRNIILKLICGGKKSFNVYLPKHSWSKSLIEPAVNSILNSGGKINFSTAIQKINTNDDDIISSIITSDGKVIYISEDEAVILAVPQYVMKKLIHNVKSPSKTNAIVNVHFKYDSQYIEYPFIGIISGTAHWLFFREEIISATISAADSLVTKSKEEIAKSVWNDVKTLLNINDNLPTYKVIKEKRATISSTPDNIKFRPSAKTKYRNLFLAGDYTNTNLPSTIEGSVKSGRIVAEALL